MPTRTLAKPSLSLKENLLAYAVLLLFFVAFFPQALFGGKYLLSNDAFFYSYPLRTLVWNMIREGHLPLWTPHIFSGYPLLSMAQLGLAYPLTWGYLVFPGRVAEQIYVLAPFLLAPIFTYKYLREVNRSFLGSILGALTFGYGGMMASPLANNGLQPNAVMWFPLLLVALERTRRAPIVRPLLLATFAYSMSVFTGYGQGFVYIGILSFLYALFLVVTFGKGRFRSFESWRPVIVIAVAGILSIGLAAFQIFETWQAIELSVRSTISYDIFTQGSLTLTRLLESITRPLFFGVDMYAFVPPLALLLSAIVVVYHFKKKIDPRILFWLVIVAVSCVLMLGSNTPLYRLVYNIPILNRFRVPSRHTFEFTFAIAVLSAFGWDYVYAALQRKREQSAQKNKFALLISVALVFAAVVVGYFWWRQTNTFRTIGNVPTSAADAYLFWKLLLFSLTALVVWQASAITRDHWRQLLLLGTILIVCYVEPAALVNRWWGSINLSAERFNVVSDASKVLKQFPAPENRIYTRVDLFSEQYETQPRLDPPNLSAIVGLQNVGGYEPLIFERYSRALGGVGLDSVHRFSTYAPDETLLSNTSHVLDLLNTTYLVSYSTLATSLEPPSLANAIVTFQMLGEIAPNERRVFAARPILADSLLLVTSLSNSVSEQQGSTVARVRLYRDDGTVIEKNLLAGVDTAEWAHERPDVRQIIKHNLATVFDITPVTEGFGAYRFRTEVPFGGPTRVKTIEVENLSKTARLALYGGAVVNNQAQKAAPLTPQYPHKWTTVYDQRETLILKNTTALPRVWLVAEAEAVDSEEALKRIRGESSVSFDPKRTALLEVAPSEIPKLPGGLAPVNSTARIMSYDTDRLTIETTAPTATFLVVSEIFYPGWIATIDGQETSIYSTNYLLRGVALPPGNHKIEMHYRAPLARRGLIITAITLIVVAVLAFRARRKPIHV